MRALLPLLLLGCVASGAEEQDNEYTAESVASMRQALIYARQAGLACANLPLAGAIAMAESSLNTTAKNYNGATSGCPSGSVDRGLWQINSCYHPSYSSTCVFDGACNARAMAKISDSGTDWSPWWTYKSGAYKKYMNAARAAYDAGIAGCNASGGSTDSCKSGTLGRDVPERTCVESKFDNEWYTCVDGAWKLGKLSCVASYPL
jgi:hypothetical protein